MRIRRSALLTGLAVLTVAGAQAGPVQLQTGVPGLGVVGSSFFVALPIRNESALATEDVQVTGVSLASAPLLSPAAFPVDLGGLVRDESAVFEATFDATGLQEGTAYTLTVTGTYVVNAVPFPFTLSSEVQLLPPSPGSAVASSTSVVPETSSGASHTNRPPLFEGEANMLHPPTPTGPFVAGGPQPPGTVVTPFGNGAPAEAGAARPALEAGPLAVTISSNQGVDVPPADIWAITEPSGSAGGGVVLVTFNPGTDGAAYSVDGGATYTTIDETTLFNGDKIGLCCDQVVQYVPKIDRFVWLLQGLSVENGGEGAYRLMEASPADIKKHHGRVWTSWALTPALFGQPTHTDFDFPSVSVGDNSLYVNWDIGFPACGTKKDPCNSGREVIRIPLAEIKAGGTIHIDYTDPSKSSVAWADHLTQDTGDEIFWAGHNTSSQLRVFSWAEGSNTYFWRDRNTETYTTNPVGKANACKTVATCKTVPSPGHVASLAPNPVPKPPVPVTRDWLWRTSDDAITGATRSGSRIWFAWNAAPSGNFPEPYIEMVVLDRSNDFSVVHQDQIWNPGFAFAQPSLATNACTTEVGLSLAWGGGAVNYPNHAVGFWGDFVVYTTSSASATSGLYGDYTTIRQNHAADLHGAFFDAFGYGLNKAPTAGPGKVLPLNQVDVDIRYVTFGRGGACAGGGSQPRP